MEPSYQNDPAIIALLNDLDSQSALLLPPLTSHCGDITLYDCHKRGPAGRDYSNKLVYAPERGTALYAGGSHGTLRPNDVWELHLGSNSWHMLFAPEGGNHALLKGPLYYHAFPKLTKDPKTKLPEKEQLAFDKARTWWKEHAHFRDGHVVTKSGGPIMPSHTWDAFTYDASVKKIIWGLGAGPGSDAKYHGLMSDGPLVKGNPDYTNMWTFEPATNRWHHYQTKQSRPDLRGMGATMTYIPELKKTIYYVSAQNVTPPEFEMWTYDAANDKWEDLKPNKGTEIRKLSLDLDLAPRSEQQSAYSPKAKTLVSVLGPNAYAYDLEKNEWSKICHDPRIDAHDARSVFAYDSAADVFLLANPKSKKAKLAAFSLKTKEWTVLEKQGNTFPKVQWGNPRGYYDPEHNVFVIHHGHSNRIWIYRHSK